MIELHFVAIIVLLLVSFFIGFLVSPTEKYTDTIDNLKFERDSLIKTRDSLVTGLKDLEKKTENLQRQIGTEDFIPSPVWYFGRMEAYNPINDKIASLEKDIEERGNNTRTKFEALEKFLNIEFVEAGTKELAAHYKKITHPLDPMS